MKKYEIIKRMTEVSYSNRMTVEPGVADFDYFV